MECHPEMTRSSLTKCEAIPCQGQVVLNLRDTLTLMSICHIPKGKDILLFTSLPSDEGKDESAVRTRWAIDPVRALSSLFLQWPGHL